MGRFPTVGDSEIAQLKCKRRLRNESTTLALSPMWWVADSHSNTNNHTRHHQKHMIYKCSTILFRLMVVEMQSLNNESKGI